MTEQDDPAGVAPPAPQQAQDDTAGFDDWGRDAPSLTGDVRELVDDAFAAVDAELEYQKSRAAFAISSVVGVAALGGLAVAFALLSLLALTVGLVIALTPILTAFGAMAAVVVGYLAIAAVLGLVAISRWRRMVEEVTGGKEPT